MKLKESDESAYNDDADNVIFGADVSSSILPNVSNAYDLGSGGKGWRALYATSGPEFSDSVLGVQIINGKGDLLNFGGQVMKNVAGYDVSKLLVGSMGRLALVTQISLKILPQRIAKQFQLKPPKKHKASELSLNFEDYLVIDPTFYRPEELEILVADPIKARNKLGWNPKVNFKELAHMMLQYDYDNQKKSIR